MFDGAQLGLSADLALVVSLVPGLHQRHPDISHCHILLHSVKLRIIYNKTPIDNKLNVNLCQNVKKLCLAFIQSSHIPYFLRTQGSQFYNTQSVTVKLSCQVSAFITCVDMDNIRPRVGKDRG